MDFLRKLINLIMLLILPISNCLYKDKINTLNYKDYEINKKTEREAVEYHFKEYDISVSKDGNDSNNGSEDSPVMSVEKAIQLAKEKRNNGITEEITIWVHKGDYFLAQSLNIEDISDLNIFAYLNDEVAFTGSKVITDFAESQIKGMKCFVASINDKVTAFIKNGEIISKTRYPETEYFRVDRDDHSNALFTKENTVWEFTYGDKSFAPDKTQEILEFKNQNDVTVKLMHYWMGEIVKIDKYNTETKMYDITPQFTMTVNEGDRYYFENVYETFNKAGQWYYDSEEALLYYLPLEGEKISDTKFEIAVNEKLINILNCKNISFNGITFKNTASDGAPIDTERTDWLSPYGLRHPQAEIDLDGIFCAKKTKELSVKNCNFTNTGYYAIKLNKEVQNAVIEGCLFTNLGAGGIYIDGYNVEDESLITKDITVYNNKIDGYGRNYASSIGVLSTNAKNLNLSHNEVCNGYYSAFSVGWVWGYDFSVSENNKICDNLIYNIGQGWLSDMGGIYTLGIQKNTVISGNVIYNVSADKGQGGYGGWGIYLDEGSSYMTVENNLVYDCGSQSFHQHYGKDNIIKNNIFALSQQGQIRHSKTEGHNQFTLISNIIVSKNQPIYACLNNFEYKDSKNLYWDYENPAYPLSAIGEDLKFWDKVFPIVMKKSYSLYNECVIANPMFKNIDKFDFTLSEENEDLKKINFKIFNYKNSGTVSKF